MRKLIGTLVPLSALISSKNTQSNGTFEAGLLLLEWLKATGQSGWQMLPLYQTQLEEGAVNKYVPSPYKSYGIGLDPKYLSASWKNKTISDNEKEDFLEQNKDWIDDYALFCALRDNFKTDDWRKWDDDIKNRTDHALRYWKSKLEKQIDEQIVLQTKLHLAFRQLRNKACNLDIKLIGDLPFYVTVKSPLVWVNKEAFQVEKDGNMSSVTGIPNSPSAHFGRQVWGHPLYNWARQKKVMGLWKLRLGYLSGLYDRIRIDHAKAFFNYGVIDVQNSTEDKYVKGPGPAAFKELIDFCREKKLEVFAEDSGEGVGELRKLLYELGVDGIKIFRFAYDEKKAKINREYADVKNYPRATVVYTTTHDTETLVGYLNKLAPNQKEVIASMAGVDAVADDKMLAKELRNALVSSEAETVIIPIQDWLLTTERINVPGTEKAVDDPNWSYKLNMPIEKLPLHF